ncbi:glycosyltransferase Gtf1 [Fructobacillus pseudoficulneus]|uniref:Glycosyltransferase Gtf1 n=1 Tax=Fructobacillus pseudoficulneus TaxID=220714 RepID=A0A3F3H2A8_9LACO|nr:glycosyltransferase [Fructobacillus pseudoficulneus]GAP02718.1 glycosyltransferase Gtf1 [Fructobacillus pseudoficulneus]SEH39363.1 Glycosyltransferase involved in cell wall bisynthesis [Fructobacillus pseudoficulneus]
MNFFLNQGIGHGNSGVEHAEFYRAQCFSAKKMPFKLVFSDLLPELHTHLREWGLKEAEVIGLYDFLLADDPTAYLENGSSSKQLRTFSSRVLTDQTNTQRIVTEKATGGYTIRRLKDKLYSEKDQIYIVDDAQVELVQGDHRVTWSYRPGPGVKVMQNILLENFRGENYFFQTFEKLVSFFLAQLDKHFGQSTYFIDRGTFYDEALVRAKKSGSQQKIVGMVHANHFVENLGGHPLFNNFYQYSLDHLDQYDALVVATKAQKEAMHRDLQGYTKAANIDKIVVIPVGGVTTVAPAKQWTGGQMRLVTASRLHQEKHLDQMIDAVKILVGQGHDVILTIYGAGAEKDKLVQQAKDAGLASRVKLAGLSQQVTKDIRPYDVFVSASYSEGFGLTYLEALSVALPIASYANDFGAKELVTSGQDGHLADFAVDDASREQNVNNLSAAILACFTGYDALSAGAVQVAENYQLDRIESAWVDLEKRLACALD